ncbi:hypothetical protein BLOT_013871 [Blomia tropicalis]|nr:hypothetical protein BLOT_013871 [Blomia tropicalis]
MDFSLNNDFNFSFDSLNGSYQKQTNDQLQTNHNHQPQIASPLSLVSISNVHHSHSQVELFQQLAQTISLNIPIELTKHLLTLIRLGVPPDEIYFLLSSLLKESPTNSNSVAYK